jgi:hypothetical protein
MHNRWQWRQLRASLALAMRGASRGGKPRHTPARGVARGVEPGPRLWCACNGGGSERLRPAGEQ